MKRVRLLLLACCLALIPASAYADDGGLDKGFVLRVDGDLYIGPDESVESAVVINGRAVIEGRIKETLVIINGDVVLIGSVGEDVVIISGDIELGASARVAQDVVLIDANLLQASGSVIGGEVKNEFDISIQWWELAVFSVLVWLGMTIVLVVAGLLFAAIGGRQLAGAADLLTSDAAFSILAAVVTWVALPIAAVLVLFSVVGIPLGLSVLLFFLPAVGFLGYLVAAARLGGLLLGLVNFQSERERPYLAVVIGLVILQLLLFVPVFGWLVAFVAGLWGSGGLALYAWRAWRGSSAPTAAPA